MGVKKIAIVGLSDSAKGAPWLDPEWEMWGLPWDREHYVMCDRLFEIHAYGSWNTPEYWEELEDVGIPVYMQEQCGLGSLRYPIEDVVEEVGDWFTCSTAYMLALAIHEKPDVIGMWGITGSENYAHQRPNLEYLLWVAKHKGIKITMSDDCQLMQGYKRYGT
jgi:hypothetical protein